MKRILFVCAALLVLVCVRTAPAHAFGLGLVGNFDGGYAKWDVSGNYWNAGAGFVMDTNLARNELFNYRLDLTFTNLHFPAKSSDIDVVGTLFNYLLLGYPYPEFSDTVVYENCFAMTTVHYFGFGVYRSERVRFWLGPQITFGGMLTNITGLFAGIGFAMGLNINIGRVFTLSITGAGRFLGGAHFWRDSNGVLQAIDGYNGDGMVTLAFIFRIAGDSYK